VSARVAIVGCGWWATQAHLPALARNADAQVVALVDPDAERRERAARAFGQPPGFASVEELLEEADVDAAIVAVPHAMHHGAAGPMLDRGIHVLVEKPLAIAPGDARDLARRAQAAGAELIVGYPWHFSRQALAVRSLLQDGRIGEIEHVACLFASVVRELYRGNPEPYREVLGYSLHAPGERTYADPAIAGGGQGQTQVTHAAALLLWVTGLAVESLAACTARFELEVDLADAVALRFRGGAVGTLASTGSVVPAQEELLEYRLFGRQGDVLWDVTQGRAHVRGADGAVDELIEHDPAQRYPEWAPSANLVDVALGRAPNGSPAALGVAAVELVDAMYRSATSGCAVALPHEGMEQP
jgi:predicted dehydrogenase